MKRKYIISETQDVFSECEGYEVEVSSLSQAKRLATRGKVFQGTALKITSPRGMVLSYKIGGGQWVDTDDWVDTELWG